jgi:hypothetical protein
MPRYVNHLLAGLLIPVFLLSPAAADEGMWLFNDLPRQQLKSRYDFTPSDAWAEHVMKASVRFNSGGSASFVSSTGLVLTNHHVGAETLQKLSTPENNYYQDGFYAGTRDQELAAPDLELNQLISIEDVTERVNAAVKPGVSAAEAAQARRAVMAEIENESLESSGLRSDVVTLYGGGRYHLYRYKKYTDVRLVWAPESAVAFFGGDADNFEYPRYCLDVCLFRVYEDGQPAKIEHFLKWSRAGAEEGELVFVSGNPGRTQRILTLDALKYQRDHRLPVTLDYLRRREILLQQYGFEGEEAERQARDDLFGVQNSRKALTGMLLGLQDPSFMRQKKDSEKELLEQIAGNEKLRAYQSAWAAVAKVQEERKELHRRVSGFSNQLYQIAHTLVIMAAEDQKPSAQRLREFRESARESLEQELFSPAPIYPQLEQTLLGDSLGVFVERRGGDDPLVAKVLAGKNPLERAAELVQHTRLIDVAVRQELAAGGPNVIQESQDPLIQLARLLEEEYRAVRAKGEELSELETQAYAQIAECLFATQGTSTYPDATFTLRLSFGTVKGYVEEGQPVPAWTTLGGIFEHEQRHGDREPWKLPPRWHAARDLIDAETPFNFVCTNDIIGGNSGSPVLNRQAELVGVIFDGNIQSLTSDYYYSDAVGRAVAVHSSAVREALRNIYKAGDLADELGH